MRRKPSSHAPEKRFHVVMSQTPDGDNSTLWNIGVFETCGDAADCARLLLGVRPMWAETRVLQIQGRNEVTVCVYRRPEPVPPPEAP